MVPFVLASALTAAAQSKGDWNAVRRIDRESLITVKATKIVGHRNSKVRCEFVDTTEDKLFCDEDRLDATDRLAIDRNAVREVRLEFSRTAKGQIGMAAGAGIGAAAGALFHSSQSGYTRGGDAINFAVMGGAAGWLIARNAPIFHRGVIYKR